MPVIGSVFVGIPFGGFNVFTALTAVFWLWMLVDCALNKKMRAGSKVCWFIFIFFTQIVGALIYFFLMCQQRNPIEALRSYSQSFTRNSQPVPPLYVPPQQPGTPVYTPPAGTYNDYAGGYREQKPGMQTKQAEEASPESPSQGQPEYDQPIISYPEMPTQQQ